MILYHLIMANSEICEGKSFYVVGASMPAALARVERTLSKDWEFSFGEVVAATDDETRTLL